MRVCINYLEREEGLIAPVIFAHRLGAELKKQGIRVVGRQERHEILLAIIRDNQIADSKRKGARVVQRLDGVYHELDEDYEEKNRTIRKTFEEANAIIYQSEFSKRLVKSFFGNHPGAEFTIHNGVDPNQYPFSRRDAGNLNFLAVAKWAGRPNKRLDSILEGFKMANLPGSHLTVLGPIEEGYVSSDKITFTGPIENEIMPQFYDRTGCLIHLCYDDNCPNAVVEALVSGIPTICTSSGGTPELVQDSGEIIDEVPYDLKPNFRREIPEVSPEKVAEAIERVKSRERIYRFPREDLHIETCAKKYIEAFETVLST